MKNIKVGYIPIGHVVKINNRTLKIKKFIKKHKLGLIIGGASMMLFSTYTILIMNFINLIKIIY